MTAIAFDRVSFFINGACILRDLSFELRGMRSLMLCQDETVARYLRVFLTGRCPSEMRVSGRVLIDGHPVPAEHLHLFLNQHRLFDANESVREILRFVSWERADEILPRFGAEFAAKLVSQLNIEETRVLEVILAVLAAPPLVFIPSLDMSARHKRLCIGLVRECLRSSAVLLEIRYAPWLDGTIVVARGGVLALDGADSALLQRECLLNRLGMDGRVPLTHLEDGSSAADQREFIEAFKSLKAETGRIAQTFAAPARAPRSRLCYKECPSVGLNGAAPSGPAADTSQPGCAAPTPNCYGLFEAPCCPNSPSNKLRMLYRENKCENLVMASDMPLTTLGRLLQLDIYRVNLRQSLKLAYRKYSLMINRYSATFNIYRNIFPFMLAILAFRVYRLVDIPTVRSELPCFWWVAIQILFGSAGGGFTALFAGYLFCQYILKEWTARSALAFLRSILRNSHSYAEFEAFTAAIYLAFFYSGSTVFEEDVPFIVSYTNILFTPGTYVVATVMYLAVTHVLAFYFIGRLLGISCLWLILANATMLNVMLACCRTKRLREALIGIFATLYMSSFLTPCPIRQPQYVYGIVRFLLPPVYMKRYYGMEFNCISALYVLLFYVLIYVWCCYKLSTYCTWRLQV
ncbi:hypothetical protein PAPHI01_0638 [Pancytospora philotis]|nr:hypothetical protein PAPHI01_0638 [Pancytospora philotis]